MVKVAIWGSLQNLTGGEAEIEVDASTMKEVLDRLAEAHPALKPQIKRGVSLAVDGEIYRNAWFTPVNPDSEVILMPYMVGG
ncbi:MAG: MoaD/ThiS family protein [Pseudomonadota bacterium]